MGKLVYVTSEDAEAAFYRAFERGDLDAMMVVWAEGDDIVCIHPVGPKLQGRNTIAESWRRIFSGDRRVRFDVRDTQRRHYPALAVHVVHEHIYFGTATAPNPPIIATNIYQHTGQGWQMILHHASPVPAGARAPQAEATTLH